MKMLYSGKSVSARITAIYFLVGTLWIVFSDHLLMSASPLVEDLARWQLMKGLLFVTVTSLLLYFTVRYYMGRHANEANRYNALVKASEQYIWSADPNGKIIRSSEAIERLAGVDASMTSRGEWMQTIHPDDQAMLAEAWAEAIASGNTYSVTFRMRMHDGSYRYFQARAVPIRDADGNILEWFGSTIDIDEIKQAEQSLAKSEESLRMAIKSGNIGLWEWDLSTNHIEYSEQWKKQLGYEGEKLENVQACIELVHADDVDTLYALWTKALESASGDLVTDFRIRHKNGSYRWFHSEASVYRDENGKPLRMVGAHLDITDIKDAEERMEYLANHDPLVDLPNRRLLPKTLDSLISDAEVIDQKLGVMYLDLDDFKAINDSLGHDIGDALLVACSERINTLLGTDDFFCRAGGDEFIILHREKSEISSLQLARRLLKALELPFHIEHHEVFIKATIGVSLFPDHGADSNVLMRNADVALHHGKQRGRNRIQVFSQYMEDDAQRWMALKNGLQRALHLNEISVHYQPQYSLKSGKIVAFEALARWHSPELGYVSPADFIPVAESSGLIDIISEHVLKSALAEAKRWHNAGYGDIRIGVNISARQLHSINFVESIRTLIRNAEISPSLVELEITETGLMENLDASTYTMRELSEMGVPFAIDDFGTGYSSLNYLHRLPVSTLKIDKSFVDRLDKGPEDSEIVTAIIVLASSLGVRVVAEGVETEQQESFLRDNNCDYAQGYLFSAAMPAEEAFKFLRDQTTAQASSMQN